MTKEWYRNNTWNDTIASEFEARLKRARGNDSKAQYLNIQACHLLFSPDPETHPIGIALLNRLFTDYPLETMEVTGGYDALGEYYLRLENWQQAEHYFRLVLSHFGTSYILTKYRRTQLKLAQTLLHKGTGQALDEAYSIVRSFPATELTLNNHLFYFYYLAAAICDALNKRSEAKEYAGKAVALAQVTEPQFTRHKTVGITQATDQQIKSLQSILDK